MEIRVKTYKEILEERKVNKQETGLAVKPEFSLMVSGKNATSLIEAAHEMVPALQTQMLKNDALMLHATDEEKKEWLALTEEAIHSTKVMPRRRSMSQKKGAVLQDNRFHSASSKYHQAILEQGSYTGFYQDMSFSLKEAEIKLEELVYKKKKLEEKFENANTEDDKFFTEKKLQKLEIKIIKQIHSINGILTQAQEYRQEIKEWSEIKEELYNEANAKGELWSPDSVDGDAGYEEISLGARHIMNYLILKNSGGDGGSDISSVLNIEGLALTAIKESIKSQKLGLILNSFSDEQINLVWRGIFGHDAEPQRNNTHIAVKYGADHVWFVSNPMFYKQAVEAFKLFQEQQKLEVQTVEKIDPFEVPEFVDIKKDT